MSSFIDTIFEYLFDIIGNIFNIIWSVLNALVYGLISMMYSLFDYLLSVDILSANNISGIYQRVTMIITIVMIFYISFEFVKYVMTPDSLTDKQKGIGNITKRIVIAILLIAFMPQIFTLGYDLQRRIVHTNVIGKVITGNNNYDHTKAAGNFVADTFSAFYRVNYENCAPNCEEAQKRVDSTLNLFRSNVVAGALGSIDAFGNELWDSLTLNNDIQYDGLLALIFGGFMLCVLFSYNLDLATRYSQLIFCQITAPIAIISYIVPQKDNMFNKWTKVTLTTYLDVFIRIAILQFMMLMMSMLSGAFDFYNMTANNGNQINIFVYLMLLAGLFLFMHRIPKILKELMPSSGGASIGFDFNAKNRTEPFKKSFTDAKNAILNAAALGARAYGILKAPRQSLRKAFADGRRSRKKFGRTREVGKALLSNAKVKRDAANAAGKAAKEGGLQKGLTAANKVVQEYKKLEASGGDAYKKNFDGANQQKIKAELDLRIADYEAVVKAKENAASSINELKINKTAKTYQEAWDNLNIGDPSERVAAVKTIEKASRVYVVSDRSSTAEAEYKQEIESAVRKVYGIAAGTPLSTEAQKVFNNLINNMEIGSTKLDTAKSYIEEAARVSDGIGYGKKDSNGNPTEKVDKNDLTKFAKDIGDVADQALTNITITKNSEEYRSVSANVSDK